MNYFGLYPLIFGAGVLQAMGNPNGLLHMPAHPISILRLVGGVLMVF